MQQLDISSILASPAQTALALVGAAAAAFAAWSIVENMPSKTKPPGPWRWPIVGTISLILNKEGEGKVHELLWNLYQKYGKISYIELLGRPVAIVADSELVRHILTAQSEWRRDESLRIAADSLLENALFVLPSGDLWHHHRKNVQPAFGPTHLRQAGHITHSMTLLLCDHFTAEAAKNGGSITVDMHRELGALALDVIGVVAFSHRSNAMQDLHSNTKNIDWDLFEKISEILEDRVSMPFIYWYFKDIVSSSPKVKKVKAHVQGTVQKVVSSRRELIAAGAPPPDAKNMDLLDRLLQSDSEGNVMFTDKEIVDEVLGFYIAGHETTANTLTFVLFELCNNPKMAERLTAEVIETRNAIGGDLNADNIHSLKYMDAFIKEAQRLHSVVPVVARVNNAPLELGGYYFPAKRYTLLSIVCIHKDPKLWRNPEVFDPERFLGGQEIVPGSFLPFGDGPHNCIGQKMAMIEIKITLAHLVTKFRFELVPDQKLKKITSITTGFKSGMKVKVTPK